MSLYIVNRFFKQESKKIKRTEMQVLRFLVLKGEDAENGLIKNIYPSMETVASYCGISDKSARRAIKNIFDEQLIFSDGWSKYGTKRYITTHQALETVLTQIDDKDSQVVTMAGNTSVTMTDVEKSIPINMVYRSDISTPASVTLSPTSVISAPQMSDNHLDHCLSLKINKLNIDLNTSGEQLPDSDQIYLFSCDNNISEERKEEAKQSGVLVANQASSYTAEIVAPDKPMTKIQVILSGIEEMRKRGDIPPNIASKTNDTLVAEAAIHIKDQINKGYGFDQALKSFQSLVKKGLFQTPNSMEKHISSHARTKAEEERLSKSLITDERTFELINDTPLTRDQRKMGATALGGILAGLLKGKFGMDMPQDNSSVAMGF